MYLIVPRGIIPDFLREHCTLFQRYSNEVHVLEKDWEATEAVFEDAWLSIATWSDRTKYKVGWKRWGEGEGHFLSIHSGKISMAVRRNGRWVGSTRWKGRRSGWQEIPESRAARPTHGPTKMKATGLLDLRWAKPPCLCEPCEAERRRAKSLYFQRRAIG